MNYKIILIYIGLFFINLPVVGQATGINTTTPDHSAILDIYSTDQGLLIPRVSLSDINETSLDGGTTPAATGLIIWNTNTATTGGNGIGYYYYDGSTWLPVSPNTLDRAYDEGGSGAGRTITADSGPVEITGTDGFLVTGTFDDTVSIPTTSGNSLLFFYPYKGIFGAGGNINAANFRKHSFATGYNNDVRFKQSFVANSYNTLDTRSRYSAAFGTQNRAMEPANFITGTGNITSEKTAFAIGNTNRARAKNSFAGGIGNYAISLAEVVLGNYATRYNRHDDSGTATDSHLNMYSDDRIFAIGNGTSDTNRSNALEIWKDGSVKISNSYTLPKSDGTAWQVMKITSTGIKWRNLGATGDKRTTFTMYADGEYPINNTTDSSFEGFNLAVLPNLFDKNNDGIVKIKAVILYSYLSGTHKLKIKAEDGTTDTVIIPAGSLANTAFGTTGTGILSNNFRNWTYSTATPPTATPFHFYLYGKMNATGDEIKIKNCYIIIKDN